MSTKKMSLCEFFHQAGSDALGKEVQEGYTLSYVWFANQFGHFNIGFLFSLLLFAIILTGALFFNCFHPIDLCTNSIAHRWWMFWIVLAGLIFWSFKEARDYSKDVKKAALCNVFPIDKRDLFHDSLTAVVFIFFGLVAAWLSLYKYYFAVLSVLISLLIGIGIAYYWVQQKIYFQRAGMPYQFRLANFPTKLCKSLNPPSVQESNELVMYIYDFINNQKRHWKYTAEQKSIQVTNPWKHLIIYGKRKTGKTNLAVGIGTEKAFQDGKVFYSSYFNLLQIMPDYNPSPLSFGYMQRWDWKEAEIMIIDDVNPTILSTSYITPVNLVNAFNNFLTSNLYYMNNNIKTIWVLSIPDDANQIYITNWHNEFTKLLNKNSASPYQVNNVGTIVLQ